MSRCFDQINDRVQRFHLAADRFGMRVVKFFYSDRQRSKRKARAGACGAYALFFSLSIVLTILMLTYAEWPKISNESEVIGIYDVHRSKYLLSNESMAFNLYGHSTHSIYIDIGCFNGQTIENFIYFNPQSILYDIITFEPDPINFRLCKRKLSEAKFKNHNIYIVPKVAWTRDGKVTYQIGHGERSTISRKKITSATTDLVQADAIDFPAWLAGILPSNETKVHIKLSLPGYESQLLRRMIVDDTILLADRWDVEWTDRSNPRLYPQRIYLQLMFDSFGFTCIGFTLIEEARKIYQRNLPIENLTRHYNLKKLPDIGTLSHYVQRPSIAFPPGARSSTRRTRARI